jgi:hypothetical protein
MNRKSIVKWFERQFDWKKDPRKEELRRYMKEYDILIEQEQDAYVPGIFFIRKRNSSEIINFMVWTTGIPTVFPPTDLVALVKLHDNQEDRSMLGQVSTQDFIEILRPHLQSIEGYKFTKKLTRECKYIDILENFLKGMLDPFPYFDKL